MTNTESHFSYAGDSIAPQPWMQLREVASSTTVSVAKSYDPSDGLAKNDPLQALTASWTNNGPVTQYVYGMVTRGGCSVALQTRSRAYLLTAHGVIVGDASLINMVGVSRFGTGADIGKGGILATGSAFSISEARQNSQSQVLLPGGAGIYAVAPGQTINARVELSFVSEFWENSTIDGGDAGTESKIVTGDTLLQLLAYPTIAAPAPTSTPTLVGSSSNIKTSTAIRTFGAGTYTQLTKPTGLLPGDTLLAIVCTQWGLGDDITPYDSGWLLGHARNDGKPGRNDVHMHVYIWPIVDPSTLPATFKFHNDSLSAEQIAVLIPLRGATPIDLSAGETWFVASNMTKASKYADQHKAPSISRQGKLLIVASYLKHNNAQGSLSQAPPAGMTELADVPGTVSTLEVASLTSPPSPSLDRFFAASAVPDFSGNSLAVSILIPGV